jgi:hypothetical protein
MLLLRSRVREGSYHREQTLRRGHRQPAGRGLLRRGRVGEAGRAKRNQPLDAGADPHDGRAPEILLGGDAHKRQGLAVEGMGGIDDLDRVHGEIRGGNGLTYRCIVFVVLSGWRRSSLPGHCRKPSPPGLSKGEYGSTRERGPYWYFQFHEGGKRKKLYLGKTSEPEGTLAAKRAKPPGK